MHSVCSSDVIVIVYATPKEEDVGNWKEDMEYSVKMKVGPQGYGKISNPMIDK